MAVGVREVLIKDRANQRAKAQWNMLIIGVGVNVNWELKG